jgi:hypothetical protein
VAWGSYLGKLSAAALLHVAKPSVPPLTVLTATSSWWMVLFKMSNTHNAQSEAGIPPPLKAMPSFDRVK